MNSQHDRSPLLPNNLIDDPPSPRPPERPLIVPQDQTTEAEERQLIPTGRRLID